MVAKIETKNLGAKKSPSHQKKPPKGTLEKSRVNLGNRVIKIKNQIPWWSQKLEFPNLISEKFIKRVAAPVRAKKINIILKIFFIIGVCEFL